MFRLCPVRASARPPRCLRWKVGAEADAGFDPALQRADDAGRKSWPEALKEQGNRSLRCGTCAGGDAAAAASPIPQHQQKSRRRNAAVHHGLKSMFEAQQVRSDRHRSVQATHAGRPMRCPLPHSECSIRFLHRQTGSARVLRRRSGTECAQASLHEIYKWPTRCLSTRPIRRKPGWSSCAATASRSLTSSPRSVSSSEAISTWRKSRASSRRCRRLLSITAATATASSPSAKSIPTTIKSRSPTVRR